MLNTRIKTQNSAIELPQSLSDRISFESRENATLNGRGVRIYSDSAPTNTQKYDEWIRTKFSGRSEEWYREGFYWLSKTIYEREIFIDDLATDKDYYLRLNFDEGVFIMDQKAVFGVSANNDSNNYWRQGLYGMKIDRSLYNIQAEVCTTKNYSASRFYEDFRGRYSYFDTSARSISFFIIRLTKVGQPPGTLQGVFIIRFRKAIPEAQQFFTL